MKGAAMYQETMNQIHKFANERHMLYRSAANHGLTPDETRRLHELNDQLPILWDRYRREYAGRNRAVSETLTSRAA
ncbi:MAG: hypothetical protein CL610_08885 [Anaerolineaceae bacterium]|nr:hypothetical protein [Anaerolineaceae bacterium]